MLEPGVNHAQQYAYVPQILETGVIRGAPGMYILGQSVFQLFSRS